MGVWNTGGNLPRPSGELTPRLSHAPSEFEIANATGWTVTAEGGDLKLERAAALGAVGWDDTTETGLILIHKRDLMPAGGFVINEFTFGIDVIVSQLGASLGVGAGFSKAAVFTSGNWAGRFHTEAAAMVDIEDRNENLASMAVASGQANVDGIRFLQSANTPTTSSRQSGVYVQTKARFANFFNPAGGPVYPCLFFTAPISTSGVIKISGFRAGSIPTTL